MIRGIREYWSENVGHIQVYRYHLEKAGHTTLIAALIVLAGADVHVATWLAAAAHLLIGKRFVAHSPGFSLDYVADFMIGTLSVPAAEAYAGHSVHSTLALVGWLVAYAVIVLWQRWAHP